MLKSVFQKALKSRYNSPILMITFNTAGALAGASIANNDPIFIVAGGVIGGLVGLVGGRIADGYASYSISQIGPEIL